MVLVCKCGHEMFVIVPESDIPQINYHCTSCDNEVTEYLNLGQGDWDKNV